MRRFLRRARKAIGGLLGAATGVAVATTVETVFDVRLDPGMADAIAVLLAAAGTWLAPKNEEDLV